VPTPRYLLDENDDIDEVEAERLPQRVPWVKVGLENLGAVQARHVVLIGSRLSKYREALGAKALLGKILCGVHITSGAKSQANTDLYDFDEDDDENVHETLYEVPVYRLNDDLVVIVLPALEPSQCNSFARGVLSEFKPTRMTLLVAGTISGPDNVLGLYSTCATTKSLKPVSPPFSLTGLPASILSYAEINSIPAIAAVVRSEGPPGFEAVDHYSTHEDVCAAIELLLGIPKGSVKVSLENEDRSLYI
jgi:hypothetical protein